MNPDKIAQPSNFVVKVTEIGPIEAKRTVGTYVGKTVGTNIDEALNTVGKTVGTNDEALKTVGETVGTNDEAFKAVIVGTSIEDLKNGVQIAMSQPPQPAPSTPLSPRPPPPPLSPRPPPPTSPPPANESLYEYELTSEKLVDRSTKLDRSWLPSRRQSQPTAVPQSKPQEPEPAPSHRPLQTTPATQPPIHQPTSYTHHPAMLYIEAFRKLNLNSYGGYRYSIPDYIEKFGCITHLQPFGDKVFDGCLLLLQTTYSYRTQFVNQGRLKAGWFLCPHNFSRRNARAPPSSLDSQKYPAIFIEYYGAYHVELKMACQNILMENSHTWLVHPDRVVDAIYLEWNLA